MLPEAPILCLVRSKIQKLNRLQFPEKVKVISFLTGVYFLTLLIAFPGIIIRINKTFDS